MSSRTVLVSELNNHLGSYIEFGFNYGWGDMGWVRGYIHGTSPFGDTASGDAGYSVYLHTSDKPKLPKGEQASSLGGHAMALNETVTILEAPKK